LAVVYRKKRANDALLDEHPEFSENAWRDSDLYTILVEDGQRFFLDAFPHVVKASREVLQKLGTSARGINASQPARRAVGKGKQVDTVGGDEDGMEEMGRLRILHRQVDRVTSGYPREEEFEEWYQDLPV
jgi:hypothetical protein